jgi:exodeoxyribonuclease VII small subunit
MENISYTKAIEELEGILRSMENQQEINMDLIAEKVKRASVLITYCKKQLTELDGELEKLLQELG